MPRVLIIKTSSMGDIVHNMPVVADLRRAHPAFVIDWVVEEAYADLVGLVDGVSQVIPVALRRWRREPQRRLVAEERRAFVALLQRERYDIVLDTQGLLKSALIGRRACLAPHGARVGFSFGLVRERLARFFYDRAYAVDPRLHAIERMRALAAATFGDAAPTSAPRFELAVASAPFGWLPGGAAGPLPYVVLLHATARVEKAWPPERWASLIVLLCTAGITPVLPSGNAAERAAAEAFALEAEQSLPRDGPRPIVAPAVTLVEAAALLAGARAIVGVDTGLLHLAAALDVPTVGLFGATPRWRYAPYWSPNAINLGSFGELGAQPGLASVVEALERLGVLASTPRARAADRRP